MTKNVANKPSLINSDGRQESTLLINKVLVGAQLEFEVLFAPRRVAVIGINFCDPLYVRVKNETAPEDISRALTPFI